MGQLKYLQFYNLTCNDCGGWRSNRCLNGTSCTLPVANCTCAGGAPAAVPSPAPAPAEGDGEAAAAATEGGDAAAEGEGETVDGGSADGGDAGGGARRLAQAGAGGACNYTQFS